MAKATVADYRWQDDWEQIYTLTFVRGLDEREVLRRFGVEDGSIGTYTAEDVMERIELTNGCCDVVGVVRLGEWTVAFEPWGWQGVRAEVQRELSRDGGEVVAVSRHDYAEGQFAYSVDGKLVTAFEPACPDERWGTDPDRLVNDMWELGLNPYFDLDAADHVADDIPAALALASRISGVLVDAALLTWPLPAGRITREVPADPATGDPLAAHPLRGVAPELADAIDAASPQARRAASIAEARRLCELAGVADHPVLRDALAAAERGDTSEVPYDAPLARLIRVWESDFTGQPIDRATGRWIVDPCERSHRAPGGTPGGPTCPTCTPWHHPTEEERSRARARWQAATAVRNTLLSDTRTAAYEIHLPLANADRAMADPARRAAVAAMLREGR